MRRHQSMPKGSFEQLMKLVSGFSQSYHVCLCHSLSSALCLRQDVSHQTLHSTITLHNTSYNDVHIHPTSSTARD